MRFNSFVRWSRGLTAAFVTALASGLLSGMIGCFGTADTKPPMSSDKPTEKQAVSVSSALAALHPLEFEIGVPRDLPSGELNAWGDVMLADLVDPEVDDAKLKAALQPYLDEVVIERVLRRQFVPRDSVAIRDAIWARGIAEAVAKNTDNDLARVVQLFRYVTQNLHVLPDDKVPLGVFDRLQLGFGQPEDRAWTFALLAQQLKLPTVIVEPKLPDDAAKSVLVGVVIDPEIYLFDATVGLPIPAVDDDLKQVQITKVATLQQVLANDAVLRQLDLEGNPYPYQSEHFRAAKLAVIGDSTLWSRRSEALQNGMAKESTAVVFQPLVSVGPFEGVLDQVAAVVKDQLPAGSVGVWKYAEERREQREVLNAEQLAGLRELFDPFQAPRPLIIVPIEKPEAGKAPVKLEFGKGWNHLLIARTKQLIGQSTESIPMYLKLQGWSRIPPTPSKGLAVPAEFEAEVTRLIPEDVQRLHGQAAELALFWRATCQLSLGEYGTAANDFETYLTRVARGTFPAQSRYLAGLATALKGNPSRALAFLSRIDASDSQYRAARILMKRWKALADDGASDQ